MFWHVQKGYQFFSPFFVSHCCKRSGTLWCLGKLFLDSEKLCWTKGGITILVDQIRLTLPKIFVGVSQNLPTATMRFTKRSVGRPWRVDLSNLEKRITRKKSYSNSEKAPTKNQDFSKNTFHKVYEFISSETKQTRWICDIEKKIIFYVSCQWWDIQSYNFHWHQRFGWPKQLKHRLSNFILLFCIGKKNNSIEKLANFGRMKR